MTIQKATLKTKLTVKVIVVGCGGNKIVNLMSQIKSNTLRCNLNFAKS